MMSLLKFSDIARFFEELELKLIASLRRNLRGHKDWEKSEGFRWTAWQAQKLRNRGVILHIVSSSLTACLKDCTF